MLNLATVKQIRGELTKKAIVGAPKKGMSRHAMNVAAKCKLIMTQLKKHETLSTAEIIAHTGIERSLLSKCTTKLNNDGLITKILANGGIGRQAYYTVVR